MQGDEITMDKCLLIGNGLNRTLENSISWNDLLQNLSLELDTEHYDEIPLPLEFERIVNNHLERLDEPSPELYTNIKKSVINKIKDTKLPENAIHRRLNELKVDSILTTNYDYLLEYVFNNTYVHKGDTNKKYLFEATSTQKGVNFYHLHGMIASAQSICLGYEHYAGIVEKLRNEINSKSNNEASKMRIKQVLCRETKKNNTWGEKFYTSDIDIVGFNLSDCEIDIWWLITHRAFLYYSNYYGLKNKIENKITYYDVKDDIKRPNIEEEAIRYKKEQLQRQKHKLLSNNHIEVKPYSLKEYGGYLSTYDRMLDDIKGVKYQ